MVADEVEEDTEIVQVLEAAEADMESLILIFFFPPCIFKCPLKFPAWNDA